MLSAWRELKSEAILLEEECPREVKNDLPLFFAGDSSSAEETIWSLYHAATSAPSSLGRGHDIPIGCGVPCPGYSPVDLPSSISSAESMCGTYPYSLPPRRSREHGHHYPLDQSGTCTLLHPACQLYLVLGILRSAMSQEDEMSRDGLYPGLETSILSSSHMTGLTAGCNCG